MNGGAGPGRGGGLAPVGVCGGAAGELEKSTSSLSGVLGVGRPPGLLWDLVREETPRVGNTESFCAYSE